MKEKKQFIRKEKVKIIRVIIVITTVFMAIFCIGHIVQLSMVTPLKQYFKFYGVKREIEQIKTANVKFRKLIKCDHAYYDSEDNLVRLGYSTNVEFLGEITKKVVLYMNKHENSFLNDCKINIRLLDACRPSIFIRNYDFDSGEINDPATDFNYIGIDITDFPLSFYKDFIWIEKLEIYEYIEIDDITVLDEFQSLKTIYCTEDLFHEEQEEYLKKTHPDMEFIYHEYRD